jgi:hypothetical protein
VAANTITSSSVYTAASGTVPGKVKVNVVNVNGFVTGEFVTVNCDVATGVFPSAVDFNVTDFQPFDLNGAAITGLTAGFTVDIK